MRLSETRDLFARRLEFPVTRETVVEQVGSTELTAPLGENVTIAEILGRCDTDEFSSADRLYGTLMNFVGESFIGQKYYDDRGGSVSDAGDGEEVRF
jgi:hypothetical protein